MPSQSSLVTLALVSSVVAAIYFGFSIQKTPISCFSTSQSSGFPVGLQHDFHVDFKRSLVRTASGNTPVVIQGDLLTWSTQGQPESGVGHYFSSVEINVVTGAFRSTYRFEKPGEPPYSSVTLGECRGFPAR